MNYPFEKCPHFKQSNHDTKNLLIFMLFFVWFKLCLLRAKNENAIFPQMKIPFFCVPLQKKYENCLLIQKYSFEIFILFTLCNILYETSKKEKIINKS